MNTITTGYAGQWERREGSVSKLWLLMEALLKSEAFVSGPYQAEFYLDDQRAWKWPHKVLFVVAPQKKIPRQDLPSFARATIVDLEPNEVRVLGGSDRNKPLDGGRAVIYIFVEYVGSKDTTTQVFINVNDLPGESALRTCIFRDQEPLMRVITIRFFASKEEAEKDLQEISEKSFSAKGGSNSCQTQKPRSWRGFYFSVIKTKSLFLFSQILFLLPITF